MGTEAVIIKDGNKETNVTLTRKDQFFVAQTKLITITFGDGAGGKEAYFQTNNSVSITAPTLFSGWNCGSSEENGRCNLVRTGNFAWTASYMIKFYGESNKYYYRVNLSPKYLSKTNL